MHCQLAGMAKPVKNAMKTKNMYAESIIDTVREPLILLDEAARRKKELVKTTVILLIMLACAYPSQETVAAKPAGSMEDTLTLKTPTSELFMTIEGPDDKDVVILLHGGPGVPDYLGNVSKMLSRYFRTVRFDQRGVGKSKALNDQYSVEEYLSDIHAIGDCLDAEKVHLFGHSWGGLLAQLYASEYPDRVRSIWLCSPSSGVGDVWKQTEREVMMYNKHQASGLEWMSMGWYSLWGAMGFDFGYKMIFANVWRYYFKEPKSVPAPAPEWLNGVKAKAVNETRKNLVMLDNNKFNTRFGKVNVPLLLTYGKYDIYGPSRSSKIQTLPNAKYVEFENAGHLAWIQSSDSFERIAQEFYSKQNAE